MVGEMTGNDSGENHMDMSKLCLEQNYELSH